MEPSYSGCSILEEKNLRPLRLEAAIAPGKDTEDSNFSIFVDL